MIARHEALSELREVSIYDRLSHITHKLEQEEKIVYRHESEGKKLFRLVEMTDVCTAVVLTGVTPAALLKRCPVLLILLVLHIHAAGMHHGHAISGNTRREYAVEHVDAASHAFDEAVRSADTHEVSGFIHRQELGGVLQNVIHEVMRLTD